MRFNTWCHHVWSTPFTSVRRVSGGTVYHTALVSGVSHPSKVEYESPSIDTDGFACPKAETTAAAAKMSIEMYRLISLVLALRHIVQPAGQGHRGRGGALPRPPGQPAGIQAVANKGRFALRNRPFHPAKRPVWHRQTARMAGPRQPGGSAVGTMAVSCRRKRSSRNGPGHALSCPTWWHRRPRLGR